MATNIEKFVAEITDRLSASNGKIPAPLYFEIGKHLGLKCREVVEAKKEFFSAQTKTSAPRTPSVKKVAKKAAKKTPDDEAEADEKRYDTNGWEIVYDAATDEE